MINLWTGFVGWSFGVHTFTALIENLDHHDPSVVASSRQGILSHGEKTVPALLDALGHSNARLSAAAANILGQIQDASVPTIESLINIFTHHDISVRCNAIAAVGRIAKRPELCIEALTRCTKDDIVDIRRYAIAALGQFGEHAQTAMHVLVDALHDDDDTVNEFAVTTLYSLGKLPVHHEPSLQMALTTSSPYVSRYIKLLLADMEDVGSKKEELVSEY